jgi:hypothetical protein
MDISLEKELNMERNENIVVLDAGNGNDSLVSPEGFCCAFTFLFFAA